MKGISKTMLRTCAGVAIAAAAVVGGAGVASAAPVTPAATTTNHFGFCNPFGYEQWNLSGSNTVENNQFSPPFAYSITFYQQGNCLSGTMTDPYYSGGGTTGPIHGTIYGNYVTFSFTYPAGSIQGTRTFTGYITPKYHKVYYRHWVWNGFRWVLRRTFRYEVQGYVSGTWTETGSGHESSTWYLSNYVRFR